MDTIRQTGKTVFGSVFFATTIIAITDEFVVEDNFVVNTDKKARVKIAHLEKDFMLCFGKKVETRLFRSIIFGRKLIKNTANNLIIKELGGNEAVETTLDEIYAMMGGERGGALDGTWPNIFFVKDINHNLRVVSLRWDVVGWRVCTYSLERNFEWPRRTCVFYREF